MHRTIIIVLMLTLISSACSFGGDSSANRQPASGPASAGTPPQPSPTLGPLPAEAPPLPFADNPDPTACGIPVIWTDSDPAWLTGYYEGELVQPVVYLYDSHLRNEVVGQIPHGGRVEIVLSQTNPVLNYYQVRSLDMTPVQSGWVPAPFVSFEPVS